MKCMEFTDHLSAYLDDRLDAVQRGWCDDHLARCAACRRELEELRSAINLCKSLPELAPPAGFREAVGRAVRVNAAAPRTPWRRLGRWWSGTPYRGVAVAAAVLVLAVALNVGLEGRFTFPGNVLRSVAPKEDMRGALDSFSSEVILGKGAGEEEPAAQARPGDMSGWQFSVTAAPDQPPVVHQDRKIIQNADLELAVADFDQAFRDIVFLAEASGGYVENSNVWVGDRDRKGGHLRLRVPRENFTRVLTQIEEKGRVLHKNIYGQDVTQAYVDTEARLNALTLQEQRLLTILGKANTVGEVLQVESELGRVRSQIESLTATLRNYDRLVGLSTIAVNLVPPKEEPPAPAGDFWSRLVETFLRSLRGLAHLAERLVLFVVSLAPVVALGALAYLGWRAYRRRWA